MKERIIQFGTGNFLRAFADYFIDVLNEQGLYDGSIVIVSPTDSKNVDVINSQNGRYHLVTKGIKDGIEINEIRAVNSVSRALNPYKDYEGFLALADNFDFRFIITNTTESGIVFDSSCQLSDRPASSFPAKLTQLLLKRFENGSDGFNIICCELIDNNADELKKCVLQYADLWNLGEEFKAFINEKNSFCNTLVDRIVSGYSKEDADKIFETECAEDRLTDVAEPYHFWAVQGDFESELPFKKAGLNVIWTDDISFYKKRKVRVLNGAHTSTVFPALLCGIETVSEAVKDKQLNAFFNKNIFDYILPVLGDTQENRDFANAVIERFANPYLNHRWKSIALNSISKYSVRVLPTVLEYKEKFGAYPKTMVLSLAALIKYYKQNEVTDDAEKAEFIKNSSLEDILSEKSLFGENLSDMLPLVKEAFEFDDIRKAIEWSLL